MSKSKQFLLFPPNPIFTDKPGAILRPLCELTPVNKRRIDAAVAMIELPDPVVDDIYYNQLTLCHCYFPRQNPKPKVRE